MDRRSFLWSLAATTAAAKVWGPATTGEGGGALVPANTVNVNGHALVCELTWRDVGWKVYEDLRTREGVITFVSANGEARVMGKSAEPAFAEEGATPYFGLSMEDIGMADADLLAEKLLGAGAASADGDDPDPAQVRSAAPPQGSAPQGPGPGRGRWVTFVGTKEANDVAPVYPGGSTRTWLPSQHFSELRELRSPAQPQQPQAPPPVEKRHHGLIGGWMPAARTVIELKGDAYIEHIVFGDVLATDTFIVQTWHRSAKVEAGKQTKVVHGYSYPAFPPARQAPQAEAFYRAMLTFAEYWDAQLAEFAHTSLPDTSWTDMAKHCFAKELMIRPGGVSPKYGAVDRDYFGSEYDGFQDIFTSALYTNLEWGRFETARVFLDDYFTHYVEPNGMINMRGPETAQFGLTLSLLARYHHYTHDDATLRKHRAKIEATAKVLTDLHDLSLALPPEDPSRGLIRGWSESDACLHPDPSVWWQPYYSNSAFAARGLKDIAGVWQSTHSSAARDWLARSQQLRDIVIASMRKQTQTAGFMPPLPGATLPFREAMEKERPSPQQWPHRLYAELLQADILPPDLANHTIDTLRHHGGTTFGVVANITAPRRNGRDILGFISYGYAQMLLRLDRIEEYLLFLYAHRYHDHTRGSWTAGEVSGLRGGTALFCIPAQQTIPLLLRWMLVLEDSDEDRLYFGKAIPRRWVGSGQPVTIEQAPTRWGRVDFKISSASDRVTAQVTLSRPGAPSEIHVKLRAPKATPVRSVTVNGRPAPLTGPQRDTVSIRTGSEQRFEVIGLLT